MRSFSRSLLAATFFCTWIGVSVANTKHIVIEFAGGTGTVVTGAGDAWVLTTVGTDCDPAAVTPVPASCGLDLTNAPSSGNTTAAIKLGFDVKIGNSLYTSLYINRFGYVTFGAAPANGGFTFVDSLAGLQQSVVDSTGTALPFIAPFHANLAIPDNTFDKFAPFGGGSSFFRATADPIPPYDVVGEVPAFATTWIDATNNISTQMVLYQKNTAGDFYLTLRYGQSDLDPPYNISATATLPAVAGFSLTSTATDQLALTGPLPGSDGYFYEFNNGHRIAAAALSLACPSGTAQTGIAYSSALVATGGVPPNVYSIAAGNLPAGLTLDVGTGAISGTPMTGGAVAFTGKVVDATGGAAGTATSNCTITVNQAPAITSSANAAFAVGVPGSFTVTASGYPAPTYSASGLPSGVTLSASGLLGGTPAAGTAGTYPVVITASNGVAPDATQSFSLTITAPSLTIAPASINFGTVRQYKVAYKSVVLTNTGASAVSIGSVSVTPGAGTKPIDFTALSFCGSSLAPGKQCKIYVVLFAYDLGSLSATLNIADSAAGSPQQVPLSATVIKRNR